MKTVAKGAGISFTGIILGNFLGIFSQALLGRFLGVRDYGRFNLALSVVHLAIVFSIIGLSEGSARYIPFFMERGELDKVKSTIRFSLRFVMLTSVVLGIVFYFLSGTISKVIFHEENVRPLLQIFMITLPLSALPTVLISIFRAFKAVRYKMFIFDTGMKIIRIAIFVPFIFLGKSLLGAIIAYLGAQIFPILQSLFLIRNRLFPQYSKTPTTPVGKSLLSFSWPLGLTGLSLVVETRADIILLGYYLTTEDIGIYSPALFIIKMLTVVGLSFQFIFLPVVSEFCAKGNRDELEILYRTVSKWIFVIIVPVVSFIILFPKEIITLIYGPAYSRGWLALVFLAIGYALGLTLSLSGNILVGAGHPKLNLASELAAVFISLAMNVLLIPALGIAGAALAAGFSFFMRGVAALVLVYKKEKIHPFALVYLRVFLAGLIGFGAAWFLKTYITKFLPWQIALFGLGFALLVVYGGALLLSRSLDKNDMLILQAISKKLNLKLNFIKPS